MLELKWDDMSLELREHLLCKACINTRYAHYEWSEIENWIQNLVLDTLHSSSKNTVTVT